MKGGTTGEVFRAFLRLGLTSFGGPVAHLGYFRAEFVERRRWLDDRAFSDLVALCQFLPGPASSQTGFALGLLRGGYRGALAAWAGFTLPSALLLVLFAYGAGRIEGSAAGQGLLHGLKLVAVAVVAQAVWGMARTLCPDRPRAAIGTAAAVLLLAAPGAATQVGAIVLGGLAGLFLTAPASTAHAPSGLRVGRRVGMACLALYALLLVLPLPPLLGAVYRAGALVFGGGHVVLPLLRDAVVTPGLVSQDAFLAGYGAAQAVPGPLFTFAAYLGAVAAGVPGAAVALVAIFLPGILALLGVLPFWEDLRAHPRAQAAMRGINAAVVGILGAALYTPVWTSAVLRPADVALALVGFVLLTVWRAPPLVVVALGAAGGVLFG
ncbi:MAG TPA: chromate efflux transporter [Acetobacteraceae bacterium]|nr:chromate efflux transporter [Acetobacteraceae bacterium]